MNRLYMRGVILLAIWGLAIGAAAQVTGRLFGTVVDPTGSAIPGATVSLVLPGGDRPVLSVTTSAEGFFNFSSVRPELYDLTIEVSGFQKHVVRSVKVDPARETAVGAIRLELSGVSAEIAVVADVLSVQVSSADISSTITNAMIQKLPMIDRNPLALISTQAGVSDGRGPTVINGQRTSFSNVTIDGINIQDNFIRSNGLDFTPNLIAVDQIAEFTISTSNANATLTGGGSYVAFVTPSGTNQFHGSAYWYNRNSAFSANDWFNNRDGIPNPFLNQNQVGASIGGPVKRDKLLFYANYEAFRLRQQSSQNRTILTDDARQGIFTYRDTGGAVRKVNVLQAAGVSTDPAIQQQLLAQLPGPEKINNFDRGDSSQTLLRNTGGYSFLQRANRTRDNVTTKLDYHASTRHVFSGSYLWNRDILDRNDLPSTANAQGYTVIPKVSNDDTTNLLSLGWRWNPSSKLTNEFRGGFNLAPAVFATNENFGSYIISPSTTIMTNPLNTFRAQGRDTNTFNYSDNASYFRDRHNFQFGFQSQQVRVRPYNDGGISPTYTLGIGSGNTGLTAAQLPGISAAELIAANNLLATLAGYVTSYTQTFNIRDRNSGFVSGETNSRHFSLDTYGLYVQDNWKMTSRLSTILGLRWDYYTVVDERDSLLLLPKVVNNDPIGTLLSNGTLDFAGKSAGRPFYNPDRNNFAPNIGLAYDLFGNGKTALRAGYSISYLNDETILSLRNNVQTNSGLSSTATRSGLTGRISTNLPPVTTPAYKVPRTFQDNYDVDSQSAFGLPEPNLRTPYIQEWNFGIQHDIKGTVFDIRYVGNHGTKLIRAFDYNQVLIRENGFLDDFSRALSNGRLAKAATGVFVPDFNPAIAGSQQLTVFPRLGSAGLLGNATIRNLIETSQPGELAATYQINGLNGALNFFRNPVALGTNITNNYSNSTYNGLQIDVHRRLSADLQFQANYTFSKVLSDAGGAEQTRFEPILDQANPQLERARPPFDVTHAFKANGVWNLPFGSGHRLNMSDRGMRMLISGWFVSGILTWQSGGPYSILSGRGTVNRSARSTNFNTADSTLTQKQLDELLQVRMTSTGPYFIAASAINPSDGRGVAPDGTAPFTGQVFFHPDAGRNGSLQRRVFTGPSVSNLDFALGKTMRFKENQSLELRAEASNVLNHPSWYVTPGNVDPNINSTTFGKITSTFYDRRLVQFSLHYRF